MNNDDIQLIKQYLRQHKWRSAKQLLLQSHLNHKNNAWILCKLGDCCFKLHNYDLAKQCYIKCVHYGEAMSNPKYILKLAQIYQIYYDPYSITKNDTQQLYESQSLYEEVLSIHNVHYKIKLKSYFNLAQLLTKLRQYDSAKQYYELLLQQYHYRLNKYATSQIHYYYAQLLFKMDELNSDKHTIYYHFERAIHIKPASISYYYKYAEILAMFADETKASQILSRAHVQTMINNKENEMQSETETDSITQSDTDDMESKSKSDHSEGEYNLEQMDDNDKMNLFMTMTQCSAHTARKYIHLSNDDLNRAINNYMEDTEKNERKNKKQNNSKPKTKVNEKRKRKRKKKPQKQEKQSHIKPQSQAAAPVEAVLPPIVFCDPGKKQIFGGVKLIIFDLSVLAYLHSFKAKKKMNKENMYQTDTLYVLDMFGGRDRIERLKIFFDNIGEKGIKMMIISNAEKTVHIAEALRRVHLFAYFKTSVIGKEIISEIKAPNVHFTHKKLIWIEKYIAKSALQKQKKKLSQLSARNVLYVSNKQIESNTKSQICASIIIDHGFEFLLEKDLIEIETRTRCKIKKNNIFYKYLTVSTTPHSMTRTLSEINSVLYKDLKFEILNHHNSKRDRADVELDAYIEKRCAKILSNPVERKCFVYFFRKFKLLQFCQHQHQSWVTLNLCLELVNIETNDCDICRSLAHALSEYQYFVDAEFYFRKALELHPSNIQSLKAYAYFLFMLERYDEASDLFERALEINPMSKKALLGYARALSFLKERDRAEIYFKKCVEYYSEWDLAHFRYGKFLYLAERYKEAKVYLLEAINIWGHSARHYLYLAQCYDKLGDVEEFEHYLNEALKLEPEHHEAINRWERHYCKTYNASYFRRKKFVKQAPKIRPNKKNWNQTIELEPQQEANHEFKRFWVEYIWFGDNSRALIKKEEYCKRFVGTSLNDIRLVLFEPDICTILRSQVGITSNNDIKIICDAINAYKTLHHQFKQWLKVTVHLDDEFQTILIQKHHIYCLPQIFKKNVKDLMKMFGKEEEMTAKYLWKCIQKERYK
eukprot:187710_1